MAHPFLGDLAHDIFTFPAAFTAQLTIIHDGDDESDDDDEDSLATGRQS